MKNGVNYDYPIPFQGKMAKTYLWQMEQDAKNLRRALGDQDSLPGWVNTYIYTSADRLQTAARYMDYAVKSKRGDLGATQGGSMKFQPSRLSYGEGTTTTTPTQQSSTSSYEAYVPLISEFFWGDDPREELAILEAKIASYKEKAKKSGWPMNKYYEGEIAKMEARAAALRQIVSETQRSVETTQMTKVVLIGVGAAAILAILGVIGLQTQRVRVLEAQRQVELKRLREMGKA